MKISYRKYLYKVVTPSTKSKFLTTWVEGDPIEDFDAVKQIKFPLSTTDVDIINAWHEITAKTAEKLWQIKNGKPGAEENNDENQESQENQEIINNSDNSEV